MKKREIIREYSENNPFKVGDTILWRRNNEVMTVDDDWEELYRWTSDNENKIITDTGRVLDVDECEHIPPR